jgi:hypothetical protein
MQLMVAVSTAEGGFCSCGRPRWRPRAPQSGALEAREPIYFFPVRGCLAATLRGLGSASRNISAYTLRTVRFAVKVRY